MIGRFAEKCKNGRVVEEGGQLKLLSCRVCYKAFRSTVGLKLHMEETHGLVDEFEENP
jgi:hypothetical protein